MKRRTEHFDFSDLTEEDIAAGDFWADHPDRQSLENFILDFIGHKVKVTITIEDVAK